MLGFFNIFGRSPDLKALDQALRDAGVHPRTVPEAVKLDGRSAPARGAGGRVPEAAFRRRRAVARVLHARQRPVHRQQQHPAAERVESRLERAIAFGDSLDAKLLLLALHSGIMVAEVADRFDVETG